MRKLMAVMLFIVVLGCACSAGGEQKGRGLNTDSESWDYGTGYVLEKDGSRLLIVSEPFEAGASADDVLANGGMKAIWLAVKDDQFDSAQVGDHVKITIVGAVAESYPEQGTGRIESVK